MWTLIMEDSAISKFSKDFSSPLQSGKEEYVNLKKKQFIVQEIILFIKDF